MIFMNFIISVIGETHGKVIQNREAHDYLQRVGMIYEREVHFSKESFTDDSKFPDILIIRKKKDTSIAKNNMQGWVKTIKNYVKHQSGRCLEVIQ